ncbi:MAG: hypothetical protein HYY04_16135 [Chloroflexi bacterium]|nr:hypothetical protein [Chloroflexota bacterium]
MNERERFLAAVNFGQPDRAFLLPHWAWPRTLKRWRSEGLPGDVHLDEFLPSDRFDICRVRFTAYPLYPEFDREVIRIEGNTRVVRHPQGALIREFSDAPETGMPTWLEYPMKNRDDWERVIKPRLDPHSPGRYPLWWESYAESVRERDYPLGIWVGSFFGNPRNWLGLEALSYLIYDDPSLFREMCDYLAWFYCEGVHPALDAIQFDHAFVWEDMSYKAGPLCSPRVVREFMLPGYQKVTQLLREHGVRVIIMDSDGNNSALVPLWLESGINGLRPLEVAAGEDAVALRRKYGQDLILYGNIDKRALIAGREAIDREVLSKVPWLLLQGGYLPQVDHLTPPDVPFDNYRYYWDLLTRVAADPERWLSEAKRRGFWAGGA